MMNIRVTVAAVGANLGEPVARHVTAPPAAAEQGALVAAVLAPIAADARGAVGPRILPLTHTVPLRHLPLSPVHLPPLPRI